MCLSINRFSKSKPEDFETTGSSGTSPELYKQTKQTDQLQQLNI